MSSWFGGGNPFDETVERATSELLPQGQEDLALNLEICDQVRSKQVLPKDAARALRKRIGHKNPNVQLLALKLTDTVVKNGGHHFLVQVASREFMEDFVSVIRQPSTNSEVKSKALGCLQSWALAFQGKSDLSFVADQVKALKADHFIFPEVSQTSTFMVDTSAPPDWTDSDVCMRCRTAFTMTNRKHHCRNCGQTFCGTCSSKSIPLPRLGVNQAVRVCDGCYAKDWARNNLTGSSSLSNLTGAPTASSTESESPRTARRAEDDDEDLRKAIEASLKDSSRPTGYSGDGGGGGRGGYVPPQQQNESRKPQKKPQAASEEDDPDLAAAIAASLQDVSISRGPSEPVHTASSNDLTRPKGVPFPDLSGFEKENITLFADLVTRIHEMGGDVVGDRQIQDLYEQIGALQPKLIRALEEAISRHRAYFDLHEQISRAVKLYDNLLEQRLSNYGNRPGQIGRQGSGYMQSADATYRGPASGVSIPAPQAMYPSAYPENQPVAAASAPYPYTPTSGSYASSAGYPPASTPYQVPAHYTGQQPSHAQQPDAHTPQPQPQQHSPQHPPPQESRQHPYGSAQPAGPYGSAAGGGHSTYIAVPSGQQTSDQPYHGYTYQDQSLPRPSAYGGGEAYPSYTAHTGQGYPGGQPSSYPHPHPHPHHQQQQQHAGQPPPHQQQPPPQPEPPKEEAPLIEF